MKTLRTDDTITACSLHFVSCPVCCIYYSVYSVSCGVYCVVCSVQLTMFTIQCVFCSVGHEVYSLVCSVKRTVFTMWCEVCHVLLMYKGQWQFYTLDYYLKIDGYQWRHL